MGKSLVGYLLAMTVVSVCPGLALGQSEPRNPQVIDPKWLKVDTSTKTTEFQVIAAYTGLNGGLNFNGFRDGGLTLTVPQGWSVVLHFANHDAVLPHSAEVIMDTTPVPTGPVPAAFPRAFTLRLQQGIQNGETDDIQFVADKVGSYLIFCAVPGHGVAGMWIRLKVAGSAREPSVAATPAGKS